MVQCGFLSDRHAVDESSVPALEDLGWNTRPLRKTGGSGGAKAQDR